MYLSEVNVTPIKPQGGLIAFASIVIDESIYLSSIAVHLRPDGSYRLLYPTKRIGERTVNFFHPINRETSKRIEAAVFKKCEEIYGLDDEHKFQLFG